MRTGTDKWLLYITVSLIGNNGIKTDRLRDTDTDCLIIRMKKSSVDEKSKCANCQSCHKSGNKQTQEHQETMTMKILLDQFFQQ